MGNPRDLRQRSVVHRRVISGQNMDFTKSCSKSYPELGRISIIIPVYDHLELTQRCVDSMLISSPQCDNLEIIIADDCSPNVDYRMVNFCDHRVKVIRAEQNRGFLKNVNWACKYATGEFLLLANNDVLVLPDEKRYWTDKIRSHLAPESHIGLVGALLLNRDGTVQEAGGHIFCDGSAENYSRGQKPGLPNNSFPRRVDYCSGCFLAVRADVWAKLGGFDENYAPAYCEDADLALRVRYQLGLDVLFDPSIVVVHDEGGTHGRNLNSGIKSWQVVNQQKLHHRWATTLIQRDNFFGGQQRWHRFLGDRPHAIVMDHRAPRETNDSGSIDALSIIRDLLRRGYFVTFLGQHDFIGNTPQHHYLRSIGVYVPIFPAPKSQLEWLLTVRHTVSLVWIFRFNVYEHFRVVITQLSRPQARVVLYTGDLHHIRLSRCAELNERQVWREALAEKAASVEKRELDVLRECDTVVVLSSFEQNYLEARGIGHSVLMPILRPIIPAEQPRETRRGILFIGGFEHPPNLDAVLWFCISIWPRIRQRIPDLEFFIVGSRMPDFFQGVQYEGIHPLGFVDDIRMILESVVLTVAPLRYGAGIKGKVISSLAYGVPVVATTIAVEGMRAPLPCVLVGDTPEEIADMIVDIYCRNSMDWQELSESAIRYCKEEFSEERFRESLGAVLDKLSLPTNRSAFPFHLANSSYPY